MKTLILGIDPDTVKSGVATFNHLTFEFKVSTMKFFELYEYLKSIKEHIYLCRIEAGWLNQKSNYHNRKGQSKNAGERIAKNVGSNHETGRKIEEMCEHLEIEYELVRPTTSKVSHEVFKKITGFTGSTNSEMRDAGMLVWNFKGGSNELRRIFKK